MNKTIWFYLIAVAVGWVFYYIIPKKFRWIDLLLVSVLFYAIISKHLIIYLLLTIFSVYGGALLISKNNQMLGNKILPVENETEEQKALRKEQEKKRKAKIKKKSKYIITLIIIFNLAIIAVLKYCNFFGGTLNGIIKLFKGSYRIKTFKILLPLGISFYTLSAIGYIVDVYRAKYFAEKNFAKVMLFLIFVPQIIQGPVVRYEQTADNIFSGHDFNFKKIAFGFQRIFWGLFKKMVIADRLALLVTKVANTPTDFSGIASLMFMICYTIQLYCDFSGFIDIAIGCGELFGIDLPENFRQPFFSKSAQEFWRRWHITLGAWLKEYVFYSVALSPSVTRLANSIKKRHKNYFTKMIPTYIAMFFVWVCNGLWHGPEWKYFAYGMYYFVLIFLGMITEPLFKNLWTKLKVNPDSKFLNVLRHIRTLIIIVLGETIFGANTLSDGFYILGSIFRKYHGSIFELGLDYKELLVAFIACLVVLSTSIAKEKGINVREKVATLVLPVRWAIYLALILAVVIFGAYGGMYATTPFIYGGF